MSKLRLFAIASAVLIVACGPAGRDRDGIGGVDGGTTTPDSGDPIPYGPEICDDGYDNDQDGRADCADPDCSGVGTCPVCGLVEVPEATPLPLPDGPSTASGGTSCTTDADCLSAEPNCIQFLGGSECRGSYNSVLDFIGFPPGATLTDPNQLLKVCVNMEHSYLRDLQIELLTPSGAVFPLHLFAGATGGEVYLGQANDNDTSSNPVPGMGMDYCWTPDAPLTMMQVADTLTGIPRIMPAGDYKAEAPWSTLTGTPLNGMWEIRVTDLWRIDNGFLFSWKIEFDPDLVVDCAGPIIQ